MRGLALLALLLGGLLVAAVLLIARGLGWFEDQREVPFAFDNPVLTVRRGDRAVVKPIEAGGVWQRFTFTAVVVEPEAMKDPALPLPHAAAVVESRRSGEDDWSYDPNDFVRPLPLYNLGAVSPREWLQEIRPVLEVAPDGSSRLLYRATYRHDSGLQVAYYHDPARRVPGFGWVRQERTAPGREQPAIFHAFAEEPAGELREAK